MNESDSTSDLARVASVLKSAGFAVWLGDEFAASACDAAARSVVNNDAPLPFIMSDLPDCVAPGYTWNAHGFLCVQLYEPTDAERRGADEFAAARLRTDSARG